MTRAIFALAWTGKSAAQFKGSPGYQSGAIIKAGLLGGAAPMDRVRDWLTSGARIAARIS